MSRFQLGICGNAMFPEAGHLASGLENCPLTLL
jgi:hypothetical protein